MTERFPKFEIKKLEERDIHGEIGDMFLDLESAGGKIERRKNKEDKLEIGGKNEYPNLDVMEGNYGDDEVPDQNVGDNDTL